MREAIKFVGGSVAVYLVMVACSTSRSEPLVEVADRGTGGTRAGSSAGGASGGSGMSNEEPGNGGMMGSAGEVASAGERGTGRAGSGAGKGPTDGGIVDAMTDPTPDAMAQTEPTSGSRLKARYLVGDDGSKQWNYGWYDSERKENCSFSNAPDGKMRCIPASGGTASGYFSDDACTDPLVAVVTPTGCSAAAAPTYAYDYLSGGCTAMPTMHTVGSVFSGATIYLGSGSTCVSTTAPTSYTFYELGPEVPASAFVAASEEHD